MWQNILVINLMHLGDLMLTTPVFGALKHAFPQAKLTLAADKKLADLVRANPHLDECLFLDKKGRDDNLLGLGKFILKLRHKRFDLVINLHRNERASALASFSGGQKIVGYAKPLFSLFFDRVMENPSLAKREGKRRIPGRVHQVKSHFAVLREAVGLSDIVDGGLEMRLPPEAETETERLWRDNFSPEEKVVALNIGASWETKRWPEQYFAQVADKLCAEGYAIAFLGGPTDENIVAKAIEAMRYGKSDRVKVFTGKVSLGVLAGLLRRSCLFITTDSGPMHVGVAMNVPIVTMFGASPAPGFSPYDAKDILIKSPASCHPCGIHRCPRPGEENLVCMKTIKPEMVLRYAEELLATYKGRPAYELPMHYGDYECRVV